jgi:hypothetical protein
MSRHEGSNSPMNFPLLSASNLLRVLFVLLIVTSSLILLKKASSSAPSVQKLQEVHAATRRLFENRVPEHLPVRVKIKREKEKLFRELDNENWARDFELEVKNTGDKPIYTMYFQLDVPDAKIESDYQSFSLPFGRTALANGEDVPNEEDVPLKPGETIVLRIEENQLKGWDQARKLGLVPPKIRGARLIFQDLTFADGTGFEGGTGTPRHPRQIQNKQTYLSTEPYATSESPPETRIQQFASEDSHNKGDAGFQPASFVYADYQWKCSNIGYQPGKARTQGDLLEPHVPWLVCSQLGRNNYG